MASAHVSHRKNVARTGDDYNGTGMSRCLDCGSVKPQNGDWAKPSLLSALSETYHEDI